MGPKPSKFHGYIGPIWSNPTPGLDWAAQKFIAWYCSGEGQCDEDEKQRRDQQHHDLRATHGKHRQAHDKKYYYIYICSRIELKMTETETKQLHQYVCTFCYAVGFAAVFLSDANRIYHKMVSQKLWNAVVVSHVKNHPTRRSVQLARSNEGKTGL